MRDSGIAEEEERGARSLTVVDAAETPDPEIAGGVEGAEGRIKVTSRPPTECHELESRTVQPEIADDDLIETHAEIADEDITENADAEHP